LFYGNGKGKTSARWHSLALFRLNKKVCIIQFIKGNKEWEWKIIKEVDSPQMQSFQFFNNEKLSITEKSI